MRKTKKMRAYGRSCRVIKDDDWDDICFLSQTLSISSPMRDVKDLSSSLGTKPSASVGLPVLSCLSPGQPFVSLRSTGTTPLSKQPCHTKCVNSPILNYLSPLRESKTNVMSTKNKVLAMCKQSAPISFDDYFDDNVKKTIKKLGEGVYSEVFHFQENREKFVVKIVPVEGKGKILFNGEKLKSFDEILPEMAIAQELSDLGCSDQENSQHFASSFLHVNNFAVVEGLVPAAVIKEWERWDKEHASENDHPCIFQPDQLYVLFVSPHGGTDLEHFEFHNGGQLKSVYQQTVAALAVAEQCLQFEHRDLHWGNVLVSPCTDDSVQFIINGTSHKVKSHGIKVTIIDFTLSRLRRNECVLFFDLETISWLFEGQGDFQFEVYRMMRKETKKDWEGFYSQNNVFWLHYIVDKLLNDVKSNACRSKDKEMNALRRHRTLLKRNNYTSALQVFEILPP